MRLPETSPASLFSHIILNGAVIFCSVVFPRVGSTPEYNDALAVYATTNKHPLSSTDLVPPPMQAAPETGAKLVVVVQPSTVSPIGPPNPTWDEVFEHQAARLGWANPGFHLHVATPSSLTDATFSNAQASSLHKCMNSVHHHRCVGLPRERRRQGGKEAGREGGSDF